MYLFQAPCVCNSRRLNREIANNFSHTCRGSEWQPLLGVGNSAARRRVKNYLADIREEQLKARVVPRQVEPVLLADLAVISRHIETQLLRSLSLKPQIFDRERPGTIQGIILCRRSGG